MAEDKLYKAVYMGSGTFSITKPKRKLSFKENYALETLPAKMAALKAELAKLEITLADQSLFARDPAQFEKVGTRHAAAADELAASEDQWLELEILKDELDAR